MIRSIVAVAVGLALMSAAVPVRAQSAELRVLLDAQPRVQDAPAPDLLPLLRQGQDAQPRPFELLAADGAMPLKQVLACLRNDYPGQVLDAQIFERDGQPFYRIKLLGADGKVQVLTVDGRSCAVVDRR
jgi:uncharacterized membrane protein YkoI